MTAPSTVIEAARRAGRARFSRWDDQRFDEWRGRIDTFAHTVQGRSDGDTTTDAYVHLLADAVGDGSVGPLHRALFEATFVAPDVDLVRMARAFNIAEGLRAAYPWLEAFVADRTKGVSLARFEAEVAKAVQHVLSPNLGSWGGRLRCESWSLRPAVDDLLPGDMDLLAPGAVRVRDRDDENRSAVVIVLSPSEVFVTPGPAEATTFRPDPSTELAFRVADEYAHVGDRKTVADCLTNVQASVQSPAPFVAVTAQDSQNVWIVGPRDA